MNFWPLAAAFLIIAGAELGDKTQLLTLGLSTRFPAAIVIGAVTTATAALMALAVIFGEAVNRLIPGFYLQAFAGILFIIFGLWAIFGKEEVTDEEKTGSIRSDHPFIFIFISFFIAEFGDKTQLATLTLTAKYGTPIQVWIGATLGMAAVNALAALAGSWVKRFIKGEHIQWISAGVFLIFGVLTLVRAFL